MTRYLLVVLALVLCAGCGGTNEEVTTPLVLDSARGYEAASILKWGYQYNPLAEEEIDALVCVVLSEGDLDDASDALWCSRLTREQRHALVEKVVGHSVEPIDLDAICAERDKGGNP